MWAAILSAAGDLPVETVPVTRAVEAMDAAIRASRGLHLRHGPAVWSGHAGGWPPIGVDSPRRC